MQAPDLSLAGDVPALEAPTGAQERRILTYSIVATLILGTIGVVWGIVSGSQIILLDGVYGLVGVITSWLLLRASKMADEGPTRSYPFGREAVTPLMIGVQGVVLLGTLLYAAVEAVWVIRDGGSEVTAGPAIVYSALVTVSCVLVWRWVTAQAGSSDVLVAEGIGWRVASLRGIGMLVGFTVLSFVARSGWSEAAPYIDPVMVLVMCVGLLSSPIGMVRSTLLELIEGAPPPEIAETVRRAVASVSAAYELGEPDVRATKVGPKVYVEVSGVASPHVTIAQEHEERRELEALLESMPYEIWLNFELLPRGSETG